jgi:hypothetical protein
VSLSGYSFAAAPIDLSSPAGNAFAGGIAGAYSGSGGDANAISNCYNAGNVQSTHTAPAPSYAGGIVGCEYTPSSEEYSGTIQNCVVLSSSIQGENNASDGSLHKYIIGYYADGSPRRSGNLALGDITGGAVDDTGDGARIDAEQAKSEATYASLGWNFVNIWEMAQDFDYPQFRGASPQAPPQEPVYAGTLSPTAHTFPAATYGYAEQGAHTFTVTNTGNEALTNVTAALRTGTAFEIVTPLSAASIPVSSAAAISARPKTGLAAGTYTDTLTVTAGNDLSMSASLSFIVNNDIPSSGSSGGSGSADAPKTVSAADGAVSIGYTQIGGNVTLDMPEAKMTEIIGKSEGTAVIDLTGAANATSVALPKTALARLADAKLAVEFKLPQGAITLEAGAVNSIAEQAPAGSVSVGLKSVAAASLNAEQREAVGDAPVYDISVTSGNQNISDFGGAAVVVSIPYTLKAGQTSEGVVVLHLGGDGDTEKLPTTYDPASKRATFTTTHLSLYAVTYDDTPATSESGAWSNPFTDVRESDWFYGDVAYVCENGLFAGTSATAFSPNAPMTRGMIVTVLGRLYGADASAYASGGFEDVTAGRYYAPYTEWAKQSGIVSGVGGNKFGPDTEITRQDLAVVVARYADFAGKPIPATLQYAAFADEAGIAEYAKNAVQTLYSGGIVGGKPNNLFDPKGESARAEVAAILHRFVDAAR